MGAFPPDSTAGPAGGRLGPDLAARVAAIVEAAEREARAAEHAIAEHRRSAEEEARRYLAAARLHVDAEVAARSARIETLSAAARRLTDELTDAVAALTRELHAAEPDTAALPRPPWPATAPPATERIPPAEPAAPAAATSPPAEPEPVAPPEPTWSRIEAEQAAGRPASGTGADRAAAPPAKPVVDERAEGEPTNGERPVPSAARLVAIEMAVGGSSRAEVEQHLRAQLGVSEPQPLLDDVFGVASHAGSRLAWGEP